METAKVKIKRLDPRAIIPSYAHGGAADNAGMDLYAIEDTLLFPHVPVAVRTGIAIELPPGFEAQIRGRSGLGFKHGIRVAQGVGTIDPSYRGEIKGLLVWEGFNPNDVYEKYMGNGMTELQSCYLIKAGDRICQMVVARYAGVQFEESDLGASERGSQGFGSTGN